MSIRGTPMDAVELQALSPSPNPIPNVRYTKYSGVIFLGVQCGEGEGEVLLLCCTEPHEGTAQQNVSASLFF